MICNIVTIHHSAVMVLNSYVILIILEVRNHVILNFRLWLQRPAQYHSLQYSRNSPWSSSIPNPSFLCQKDNLLFAVGEFEDHCTITSFLRDADGSFGKEIDTIQLKGTCLCHLSAHSEEHFLAGSCWGDGTFSRFLTEMTENSEIFYMKNNSQMILPTLPGFTAL